MLKIINKGHSRIKQKNKPFFTVITCTLNSTEFLSRNLESVERQSYKNYEHIFIDGGSRDGTVKILSDYKNKFIKKVKVIRHLKLGVSEAFNRGIKEAKGDYLFFLNSDDSFYDKDVLADIYAFLSKHNKSDWIYAKINVVEEDGKTVGIFPLRLIFQKANKYLLKFFNFVPHQTVFMKKKVFTNFGDFDTDLKSNMDIDLFLRIANKTNWAFFDRVICNYVLRKGSVSSDLRNKEIGLRTLEKVQKRYLPTTEFLLAKVINRVVSIFNKTYR